MSDKNKKAFYEPLPADLKKALEQAEEDYRELQYKLAIQRMLSETAKLVASINEDHDTNS